MTDPHEDPREEEQLARLLSAANRDLPPPDREFLARLREQSTAAMLQTQEAPRSDLSAATQTGGRRGWLVRIATFTAAAAILAAIVLSTPGSSSDQNFASVLENLQEADTLQLALSGIGPEAGRYRSVVWVRQPGELRSDVDANGAQHTTLLVNQRMWTIDEAANKATSAAYPFGKEIPIRELVGMSDPNDPSTPQDAATAWTSVLSAFRARSNFSFQAM